MLSSQKENTAADPAAELQKHRRGRFLAVKIGLFLLFAMAVVRLVQIQIIDTQKYQEIARKQYEAKVFLPSTRGSIFDRHGTVLASNTLLVSYAADPKIVGDGAPGIARKFSRVFGKSESFYLEKLHSQKRFVWLERHVLPEVARSLNARQLEGVVELAEPKRLYQYDEIGGQAVGCTNIDNVGISGIEYAFDRQLKGVDGFVIMQRDGLGRKRPSFDYPRRDPVSGHSVTLTIDIGYQSIVEEELKRGVVRTKADAGLAVMMQPATGEILAMAHYPSVNPNSLDGVEMSVLKARTVTDMIEPGSVFKIVTAAAALEDKLVKPDQLFNAEHGKYKVPLNNGKFRLITDTHENGILTFQQGMELSSNIVMAKVSDIIGAERLYTQARNFGFGMSTGIELPGEASGDMKRPVEWSLASLNSIAYGYEVGVTPLQIAAAYAAVANGGVLMKPYILANEKNEVGEIVRLGQPAIIRRVVSPETAGMLKTFFVGAVEHGTGQPAKIPGTTIAGKTGTSRKYVNGEYQSGIYNASFVGFFPAEKPEFVCLVFLENPKILGYTGAVASAPIFRAIAERIINNAGVFSKARVTATVNPETLRISLPDVRNLRLSTARQMLEEAGARIHVTGTGDVVLHQTPEPGTILSVRDIVQLVTNTERPSAVLQGMHVPDLRGMSLRRAINRLTADHLDVIVVGTGIVRKQFPEAGTPGSQGMKITLVCEPRPVVNAQLY
jgi:cell division protein FtsI (penicillin-binding protein 3)